MSVSVSVKDGKKYSYVYIVNNFRDPVTKKSTSRIIESCGRKDKLEADNPNFMEELEKRADVYRQNPGLLNEKMAKNLVSRASVDKDMNDASDPSDSFSCTPAVYRLFWEELGLNHYFSNYTRNHKLPYDLDRLAFFLSTERISNPSSKIGAWRRRGASIFDFDDIALNSVYTVLDVLSETKDAIIKRLNKAIDRLFGRDLTIALYDVTTLYFESFVEDEVRQRGRSKEHKTQETQVVLGLLADADGIPLTYEIFPGNTAEVHTLMDVVDRYHEQYPDTDVTVVADSGLNQLINLERLKEKGYKFIVAYPPTSRLSEENRNRILEEDGWSRHETKDGDAWGFKEISLSINKPVADSRTGEIVRAKMEARCIVSYSSKRAAYDRRRIDDKWLKACKEYEKSGGNPKSVSRRTYLKTAKSTVSLNKELHEKHLRWCGYYALFTNIADEPAGLVYGKLRQLWQIEDNFRMLKSDLQGRPIYVRTPAHIAGHFVLNYLALVIQRLMMKELKAKGLNVSSREIVDALESINIQRKEELRYANSYLYSIGCDNTYCASAKDAEGKPLKVKELAKRIFSAFGIEPLRSLETAESLRKKLRIKMRMR